MRPKIIEALVLVGILAAGLIATAQETAVDHAAETAKIEAAIQSYLAAFNARDVDKLVSHWSPDGVYISRATGQRSVGREAMAKEFKEMFAGERVPQLASTTTSIDFISPNVALERGTATVTFAEDDVLDSNYVAVYVKRDGAWLLDRVTEDEVIIPPSHYEQLKDLEWMVGEWVDAGEGITIELDCRWTKNQNFLARRYVISNEAEEIEASGLQIIGWDANLKQIRSWLFDSDGGVVTGTWTKRDDHWTVQSVATLADGATGSFTSVFRPRDDGNYTWQKINQVVDGKLLPNVDEILVQRK